MNKGIIIMLAWPKTPAIQVGSWYEGFMKFLGFNKNGYYMAGHSAIVLIEPNSGEMNYFDFGRYHAPIGHGRVRNKTTDPDLAIATRAKLDSNGEISNLQEILRLLDANKEAFHGKNKMYASVYYQADYQNAYAFAKKLQKREAIPYGPFELRGTNCSRFTSSVFRAGCPSFVKKLRLLMPTSLTPTTLGNVLIASGNNIFYELENNVLEVKTVNFKKQITNWIVPSITLRKKKQFSTENELEGQHSLVNA